MSALTKISSAQDRASEDIASYLNSYPVYADAVGIEPRLSGSPVQGMTEIDRGLARIYYNPDILRDDYLRDCVIAHEVAHLYQNEHRILEQLCPLMFDLNGKSYRLGIDLIEGTAELLVEKATRGRIGHVYPREYKLAREIDRVYPLRDLYRDIEENGWQALDRPEIRRILAEAYSRPGMEYHAV